MREILFRGKQTTSGKWSCGYTYSDGKKTYIAYEGKKDCIIHEVIPETVGQYTGLTDRNGKRIFEGDIIRNIDNGDIGVIRWYIEHGAFVIRRISDNQIFWLFDNNFSKIEIIGNIHDNPELLNKEAVQNGG